MNKKLTIIFSLILCLLVSLPSFSQVQVSEDKVVYTLYFHVGKSDFDPTYRNNADVMRQIVEQLSRRVDNPQAAFKSIKVSTSTSPEGGKALNVRLASNRSRSIVGYLLLQYPQLSQQIAISSELAPDWQSLRNKVFDSDMPMRAKALEILDRYSTYYNPDYSVIDPRESQLKALNNGQVWNFLLQAYFPDLRYAKVELSHNLVDTSNAQIDELKELDEPEPAVEPAEEPFDWDWYRYYNSPRFLFALKTNMLYDVAGCFNGAVEVPIARHWSVQAEVVWPWFLSSKDKWALECGLGTLECRYWLGNHNIGNPLDPNGVRNPLTGHFFGLIGGCGYYDLSANYKGHQGELWAAGLTYGYSQKLSKHFNLEFSVSAGYMHTKYRRYHVMDIEDERLLVRNYRDTYNWIGPLSARISLSWLLFN